MNVQLHQMDQLLLEAELADASEGCHVQPVRGVMLRCLILLRRLVVKLSVVEGMRVAL